MKKSSGSESGAFNSRIFAAFILCSVGAWLAMFSFASTPSSGTLNDTSGPQSYMAGPFCVGHPTPVIFRDQGPECFGSEQPCGADALTRTAPAGDPTAPPHAR